MIQLKETGYCIYSGYVMRLPRVYLYLVVIQVVSNYAVGLTNAAYIQSPGLSWWEARTKCVEEGNTDLFTPSGTIDVPPHSQLHTYYWVGGFEMSQWRWTDNSPLFSLMGHYDIPNDADSENIPGNSALECYRRCKDDIFGLSGSRCYCLEVSSLENKADESVKIESCPGNEDEQCGTHSLVSVYTKDVSFDVGQDGDHQCAYIDKYHTFRFGYGVRVRPDDCRSTHYAVCVDDGYVEPSCEDDVRPFRRCQGDLCVTCQDTSWPASNHSCSLVKATPQRESELTDFLYSSSNYWIGLHKHITKKWINGEEVQTEYKINRKITDPGPRCLALTLSTSSWTAHWIPCNEHLPSLCASENVGTSSSMLPGLPTITTREPTLNTSPQTVVKSVTVTTEREGNNSTADRMEGEDMILDQNNRSTGIIIGVVIGVIILAAVIFLVVLTKRKDKFCFAMDNNAYKSGESLQNDVLHGRVQPGYVDTTAHQRRPGNDDKNLTSEEGNDYNTTNTRNNINVDTGNHYNHLGADEDNYDIVGVNRIDNVQDNTYNHTGTHVGSHVMVDNEHETYNHVVNVDNGGSRHNAETYDRLDIGSGSGESVGDADQCYNHLMTDVDNEYDSTRPVIDSVQNDTYNHTVSVGEVQGSDAEGKLPLKDDSTEHSSDYYNL